MTWRWHRSLIFWAGLLVMVFISWAWWDSCRMITGIGSQRLSAASMDTGVLLTRRSPFTDVRFGANRSHSDSLVGPWDFPPPFALRGKDGASPGETRWTGMPAMNEEPWTLKTRWERIMDDMPRDMLAIFLPYWLLMASAAGLWIPLLWWRWRRAIRSGP